MADPLLAWRAEFPSLADSVHLVSHSLGAMPRAAAAHLAELAELWARRSITAWEEWLPEVDRAAARIARLLGAPAGTVIMNRNVSTVQAVLASALDFRSERSVVVYSDLELPSVSCVGTGAASSAITAPARASACRRTFTRSPKDEEIELLCRELDVIRAAPRP